MERLAYAIGAFLAAQLNLDHDRQEQIGYGTFVLMQSSVTLFLIALLAAVLGLLPQALVAAFTAAVLRSVSGGAHMDTPGGCAISSAGTFAVCAWLGKAGDLWLSQSAPLVRIALVVLIAATALTGVIRFAPVEAKTRPLKPEHKERLRQTGIRLAVFYVVLLTLGAARSAWWVAPGLAGFCLQCFTLTPAGHRFAHKLEAVLRSRTKRR